MIKTRRSLFIELRTSLFIEYSEKKQLIPTLSPCHYSTFIFSQGILLGTDGADDRQDRGFLLEHQDQWPWELSRVLRHPLNQIDVPNSEVLQNRTGPRDSGLYSEVGLSPQFYSENWRD